MNVLMFRRFNNKELISLISMGGALIMGMTFIIGTFNYLNNR